MYNDHLVLDVHGHVSVPLAAYAPLLLMLGGNSAMRPAALRTLSGVSDDEFRQEAAEHVAYLDARAIDVQIIGPRPFLMFGWMEQHLLPDWTTFINDLIHQQCGFFPDRFRAACQLPQSASAEDTRHCLPELERCVTELGFVAAYVSPDPGGRRTTPGMADPYWYPLYERAAELGVPLIVHGTNSLDERVAEVPHNYQLAFITEQYLATQVLAHSDVFDRFPGLRVLVCHCGGALNRFIASDPRLPQRDLSANLFFDTCAYDEIFLSAAIRQRGVAQMCFGTESPGAGKAVRPETGRSSDDLVPVLASFEFLSEQDRLDILTWNPVRVFPALADCLG